MSGYDEFFLRGIRLPLPTFSRELGDEVLKDEAHLRNGMIADYLHYSLVVNIQSDKRSPVYVACNIDQNLLRETKRTDKWRIDSRVGDRNQLDNAYYSDNPWDRGHIARRNSSGWGENVQEAQRASDETFYYTNCCLQHENFNQDEWLALEDWVHTLDLDEDGKISCFAGPVYADYDREIRPDGKLPARIPSAFWKIVCFKNKQTGKLDVRAFVMFQDKEALKNKNGRKRYNNQTYQSTVLEIERLTGIQFDDRVYEANPLYYYATNAPSTLNVIDTPELIEVGTASDIINPDTRRQTINDDIVDIFITMAKIPADSNDTGWISLVNLGDTPVDCENWRLLDKENSALPITKNSMNGQTVINPGEAIVIDFPGALQLDRAGGIIKLFDNNNNRIDWVNYTASMTSNGKPVVFLAPRDTLDV